MTTNPILDLTNQEFNRQKNTLNLIASENYPSPTTLALLGSVWSNKYGEGYPHKRYYAGNQYTDELESYVQDLALQIFDTKDVATNSWEYGVNVQMLSGSPTNQIVLLSILQPNDTVLCPDLDSGGHLSHLHSTHILKKFYNPIYYEVQKDATGELAFDWEGVKAQIVEHQPKLLIIGFSAYTRHYQFADICTFAHQHGTMVLADIAHINGLVACGLHDSPFKKGEAGADFVSMTTHKTFRGGRGAMLFAKNYLPEWSGIDSKFSLIEIINKAVFPGGYGGPHFNKIAALGQACQEILGLQKYPDGINFKTYSQTVLDTCKVLSDELQKQGLEPVSPTENHLCLLKLPTELDGLMDSLEVQQKLERVGIITNRNKIPFDTKTAFRPSGIRLGTPALVSRGLNVETTPMLAELISDTIFERQTEDKIASRVQDFVGGLSWWY